jgi:hypothetical protein
MDVIATLLWSVTCFSNGSAMNGAQRRGYNVAYQREYSKAA